MFTWCESFILAASKTYSLATATGYTVLIGRRRDSTDVSYFAGKIDDVRLYSTALTQNDVSDLYGMASSTTTLIANYPFSGNANNTVTHITGALNGNPSLTSDRFGRPGNAYSFNGVNQYIQSDVAFPPGNLPKSFSVWFMPTSTARAWIIAGGSDSSSGSAFGLFIGGSSLLFHGNGGLADIQTPLLITSTSLNQWLHVAVSYNGTTIVVYVNAVPIGKLTNDIV